MKKFYHKLMLFTLFVAINLQLFDADANATTDSDLSAEMKVYYHDRLLDHSEPKLVHDQFGQKAPIPAGSGKTIEFRKYSPLPKALTKLVEGVTPVGRKMAVTTILATADQYGDFIKLTDVLKVTAIDRNVEQATKLLGSQAGRTLDTVTREVITAGTNKIFAPKVAADGTETAVLLRADIDDTCLFTLEIANYAAAKLERMNAEGVGEEGEFVAIVHTDTARDLLRDPDFIESHKYAQPVALFRGEIGMHGNIRYVKSTEAKIIAPADMLGIESYNRTSANAAVANSVNVFPADPFDLVEAARINAAITAGTVYKMYVDEVECTVASVTGGDVGTCKIVLSAAITCDKDSMICGLGAGKDGTAIYCTLIIGANAYGVTEIEGLGLEHIVKQLGSGGTTDPLNQRATTGWKATKVAERLEESYMIRVEHTSKRFAKTAKSN